MNLDRIEQGSSGNTQVDLTGDGTPVDPAPDSATVRVVRDNATEVIPTSAANDSGTGVFSFPYTPADAALLDLWTATWTFTYGGQVQTRRTVHEIAGGFLFSLAEFKAQPGVSAVAAADLRTKRVRAEQILERRLGCAFVPRYRRELARVTGRRSDRLRLRMPRIRAIRSVTIDGIALTAGELAALTIEPGNMIAGRSVWGRRVEVGYEHGFDWPDEPVRDAALALASHYLTTGGGAEGVDPRVSRITTPEGTIVYDGEGLGLPEVERAARLYDMRPRFA